MDDINELADICKSTHGIIEPPSIVPLSKEHIRIKPLLESLHLFTLFFTIGA
ncbi:MAG: hypothetical protein PWQ57_2612 [Desulfovibrionales bacterium]|nr:hypothetical protein [Desulfovibrionales bacterium]